jgi:hypothetical protein
VASQVAGVDAKTVMDLMIVTQYFDMMKDVGAQGKTNAVFLNSSGASPPHPAPSPLPLNPHPRPSPSPSPFALTFALCTPSSFSDGPRLLLPPRCWHDGAWLLLWLFAGCCAVADANGFDPHDTGGGDMVAEGMKKGFLAGLPAAPGFAMSR